MTKSEIQVDAHVIAGFGMTRTVTPEILQELLGEVLAAAAIKSGSITGIATLSAHADLPACTALATHLDVPLYTVEEAELPTVDAHVITRSSRILKRFGTGSVAEAAALLVASRLAHGAQARLLLPRMRARTERCSATCALAVVARVEEQVEDRK